MGIVSFKRIKKEDYIHITNGEVTSYEIRTNKSHYAPDGLGSPVIFGPTRDYKCTVCHSQVNPSSIDSEGRVICTCGTEVYRSSVRGDLRGRIRLRHPIIHPIFAGSDKGSVLATILNEKSKDIADLIACTKVYDKGTRTFHSTSALEGIPLEDILVHGEAVEYLIDTLDLEGRVCDFFTAEITKHFFGSKELPGDLIVDREPSDKPLLKGYYLHFSTNELIDSLIPARLPYRPEMFQEYMEETITGLMSKGALILNATKEKLREMLVTDLVVTPPNIRPEMEDRHHPITLYYKDIISANSALIEIGEYSPIQDKLIKVEKLAFAVKRLIKKPSGSDEKELRKRNIDPKKERPIQTIIGGKPGIVRSKMNGKRVDYSGRSVIVVNPTLELDECSVPYMVLEDIYKYHLAARGVEFDNKQEVRNAIDEIAKNVPVLLNRAPTLHRLSFLAFKAIPSDNMCFGLHPLVCSGYNADFDGDTMAIHAPISEEAIREAQNLMLSLNNIYVPASGNVTITPKQELIYGLNESTRYPKVGTPRKTYLSTADCYNEVVNYDIDVSTLVTCGNVIDTAGNVAFLHCIPNTLWPELHSIITDKKTGKIVGINKRNISKVMDALAQESQQDYKQYISRMLKLGFSVATNYAPTMGILDTASDGLGDSYIEFFDEIQTLTQLYELGFEEEEKYNELYSEEFGIIRNKVQKKVTELIGEENGYCRLVTSGARGDQGNLMQMFVAKGQVSKSSSSSFNTIINTSFLEQLSPLEHFISAYGTRKTLIDKTNKTADTGYLMRQMSHCTANTVITEEDCGTTKGLELTQEELLQYISADDIESVVEEMIRGRYVAGSNVFLDRNLARKYAAEFVSSANPIVIRSPLTCNNPCCSKCYGVDLSYKRKAVKGTPIGYMAAQSIGEPGTQLTMQTFHKGGVAGGADVTSAFDRIKSKIQLGDVRKKPTYDPIAWATGKLKKEYIGDRVKVRIEGSSKSINLSAKAILKEEVVKGEGICKLKGDHDVSELLRYAGVEKAKKEFLFSIFKIYLGQASINLKHFEILVDSLNRFIVVDNGTHPTLKVGHNISRARSLQPDIAQYGVKLRNTILAVNKVPLGTDNILEHITYSNMSDGMFYAFYYDSVDNLESAYSRVMVGMPPKAGTFYPNYFNDRVTALEERPLI